MKAILLVSAALFFGIASAQQVTKLEVPIKKVTVFLSGAQISHVKEISLEKGKQEIVFQKLTSFIDPNTVQVKAGNDVTILAVKTKSSFEDNTLALDEVKRLNTEKETLKEKDRVLRNEYSILEMDKNLLMRNQELKGYQTGIKTTDLKEAYTFMHERITEIRNRETKIRRELEDLSVKMNRLEQEIISQRSKPVKNFAEITVEIDVAKATKALFEVNYLSPNATWKPFYDLRSAGIGQPLKVEAKAQVSQTTGIEWKHVDMVLSTNDPYQNTKEPDLKPWYLYYNNYPTYNQTAQIQANTINLSGQQVSGQVMDSKTGEPLPFARVTFAGNPNVGGVVTDFDGKFTLQVPKNESYLHISFVGYEAKDVYVNSAYLKVFIDEQVRELEEVVISSVETFSDEYEPQASDLQLAEKSESKLQLRGARSRYKKAGEKDYDKKYDASEIQQNYVNKVVAVEEKKDLRVEYTVQTKMTIPSDGMDHSVGIASYELSANYEYHAVPKLDPSVYLSAQVSGWEKLNLMSGESNIYFDGTYLGKTYLDVNSTKDTLSLSLGKDNKVSIERTRVKDKTKTKVVGNRRKIDTVWEIKLKNNGGANIPVIVKDQFPISNQEDIKVKRGDTKNGSVEDKTGIITWKFMNGITGLQIIGLEYEVDYQSGMVLYLE